MTESYLSWPYCWLSRSILPKLSFIWSDTLFCLLRLHFLLGLYFLFLFTKNQKKHHKILFSVKDPKKLTNCVCNFQTGRSKSFRSVYTSLLGLTCRSNHFTVKQFTNSLSLLYGQIYTTFFLNNFLLIKIKFASKKISTFQFTPNIAL